MLGAGGPGELPGVARIEDEVRLRYATDTDALRRALPGGEILLCWDFRADQLAGAWHAAADLKWIHCCGAGVDTVLFPDLRRSDIILTNARGVFDRAMAEYVLGLVLALCKFFPQTFAAQSARRWAYRLSETIEHRRVLIVGAGSIGRCIARLLASVGMQVEGVGRTARQGDADFLKIHAIEDLDAVLPGADFVIAALPLTDATHRVFRGPQFAAMRAGARFVNVGRGAAVDESALIDALHSGEIAGAALDVFLTEPLPEDSPLWSVENLIVSPHMSGDFEGHQAALFDVFVDNLRLFQAGEPLNNIVDKQAGFVTSARR